MKTAILVMLFEILAATSIILLVLFYVSKFVENFNCFMINWLKKKFSKKDLNLDSNEVQLGYGYVVRKLINGQWILWDKIKQGAVDLKNPQMTWTSSSVYWPHCIGSLKQIKSNFKNILANRGVFAFEENLQKSIDV